MKAQHPDIAVGDVMLWRDNPFDNSVVVTGYPRTGLIEWIMPGCCGVHGFSPASRFVLAPEGWSDPPQPPRSAARGVECAHDGEIPQDEMEAARDADESPERRAALLSYYRRRIEWATRHLARRDEYLAAVEIQDCADSLSELLIYGKIAA